MGLQQPPVSSEAFYLDACCGDNFEDTPTFPGAGQVDQGDLSRVGGIAQTRSGSSGSTVCWRKSRRCWSAWDSIRPGPGRRSMSCSTATRTAGPSSVRSICYQGRTRLRQRMRATATRPSLRSGRLPRKGRPAGSVGDIDGCTNLPRDSSGGRSHSCGSSSVGQGSSPSGQAVRQTPLSPPPRIPPITQPNAVCDSGDSKGGNSDAPADLHTQEMISLSDGAPTKN